PAPPRLCQCQVCEIALEQCQGQQSQLAKHVVMNQL
ncbi:cop9 signalosome complex subunit 5, partial [Nannochloropsis oceanica]